MPLHPKIAELLATLPPATDQAPDPVAKRRADCDFLPPAEAKAQLARVVDDSVPSADGAGSIPVRVYRAQVDTAAGVVLYLHGGAFFSGDLETHDHVCRSLAAASGWNVLAVDYRLAPEAQFPAGLDDCRTVLRWIPEHGEQLGWDGNGLAVAGDSSGANFAAVLAAESADGQLPALSHQILYYPSVDLDFDPAKYPSRTQLATGYGLETVGLVPFNSFYLDGGADPQDPKVSPILRTELGGLPPALVITAEYDPLRDEGEAYADRLADAGVKVTKIRWEGANHGFVQNFSWLPEMHRAFDVTADFLAGS